MKVGDYVRFKTLSREIKIGKVIDIIEPDKESMKKYCVYDLDNNEATVDDYIIKSSPNIIDLIEVGDYVNGYLIEDKTIFGNLGLTHWMLKTPTGYLNEKNIYTIITKEQFESMKYKVGSE